MRARTGSAAARAASCRKFRRGSFILNLPLASHHSITSSARRRQTDPASRSSSAIDNLLGGVIDHNRRFEILKVRVSAKHRFYAVLPLFLLSFYDHFHCRNNRPAFQPKLFLRPSLSRIAKATSLVKFNRICVVGSHLYDDIFFWIQQFLCLTP